MFTKKQVQDMAEKDLRQQILVPLLQAMQFQGVHEYHGTTEFGKDIVCWNIDEVNNRQNLVLVVKATTVSGQSKASADIENQVRQCFSKPYIDPITGAEEHIDRCWVVSNKPISHEAVDLIKAGIGHAVYKRNVTFIGIDALWGLIEKYMPFQANLQKLEDIRQDFETCDSHYRIEVQMGGAGIQHTIAEKFPGAAQEKPLTVRSTFEFPNTDDGREYAEALNRLRETGESIKIPAAYIKNFEYSDILQQVLPPMGKDGFIQLGSLPNPKPFLIRCEFICDDGDSFVQEYLHLIRTQVGSKEATLTNNIQPIPFKLQLVLRFDGSVSFHMSLDDDIAFNIHQRLLMMRLQHCLSKPHTVRLIDLETGLLVASCRNEAGICNAPDKDVLEVLVALDTLQRKTGRLVSLPARALTEEECQDIATLRALFGTGKIGASWHNASTSMTITEKNRVEQMQVLQQLADGEGFYHLSQEEMLSLFGEQYMLGPIKPLSLPLRLVNWPDIKALLNTGYCGVIKLEFVPRDDGSFTKEYLNWLPGSS